MEIYRTAEQAAQHLERSVVTIGNFDGIHRGHQAIFAQVRALADRNGAKAVALTFEPHPVEFFQPDRPAFRLTPGEQRYEAMANSGLDAVVALSFDAALASMSPEEFVRGILHEALGAVVVIVGEGFHFGHRRAGTTETLRELGTRYGFTLELCEPVLWNGEVISSTRIREAIAAGDVATAAELLGRPYGLSGEVVHGDARGRDLGFPTANIASENRVLPPDGIYVTRLTVPGYGALPAATNVGRRPTFGGGDRMVEAYVLDVEDEKSFDLYGLEVELEFLEYLREERKFDSAEALVAQMERDVAQTRAYFAT